PDHARGTGRRDRCPLRRAGQRTARPAREVRVPRRGPHRRRRPRIRGHRAGGGDMTRVIVVDDQALVREGIRTLLQVAGIEVVAEAADGDEALTAIAEHPADVVLMDLRMPRRDGIWALEQLKATGSEVPVLVLTTFDGDELVLRALRAGARGYLLKDVTVERLARAVHALASGGTLVSPPSTAGLLRAIRGDPAPPREAPAPLPAVAERASAVLRMLAP